MKWSGGKKFEDKFVQTLKKYGYKGAYMSKRWLKQPAFIQSFAPTSLIYTSDLTDLPKVLLIDDAKMPTQDTNQVCISDQILSLVCVFTRSLGLNFSDGQSQVLHILKKKKSKISFLKF